MKKDNKRSIPKDMKVIGYRGDVLPEIFTAYPSGRMIHKFQRIEDYNTLHISDGPDTICLDGRPTAIDLFCGCGGFSLGFVQAGYQILAAVDNEKWSIVTYSSNIPNFQEAPVHVYFTDIRKLSGLTILSNLGLKQGDVDVVVGGPPCQSFSKVNTRKKVGDLRDYLIYEFQRVILEIQPKTWVMENVPAILSKKLPDGTKVIDKFYEGWKETKRSLRGVVDER